MFLLLSGEFTIVCNKSSISSSNRFPPPFYNPPPSAVSALLPSYYETFEGGWREETRTYELLTPAVPTKKLVFIEFIFKLF
jgi:hypothetical protein